MERLTHELQQGSDSWHAFRKDHFGASEAASAMGISPYTTRDALLREKATGEAQEVSAALKAVFDRGHETEIGGRKLAEAIIGDDLFPVVMSCGKLSASCDGLTMDGETAFEHKQWSASLAESLANNILPEHHKPQVQQVMHVTGARRCLFMTSNGTEEKCAWLWVEYDPDYAQRLVDAWAMFGSDLRNYTPPEAKREAVAAPQEPLPAVSVQVTGSIAVIDNLGVFGDALKAYVDRINQQPQTDDDFATLEAQVKVLKGAEDALTAAENNALGQAADIDTLRRTVAQYREIARQARLAAEKTVKAEKENRKNAIIQCGISAFREFTRGLALRFCLPMQMPEVPADFFGATKGLKTIASLQNAVNTTLVQAKLDASALADRIAANLKAIEAADHAALFADYRTLALKDADDLAAVIGQRIAAFAAEQERKLVAERERIAKEEREKADRAAVERNAAALEEIAGINQQVIIAQSGRVGVRKGGTLDCLQQTLAETEAWAIDAERFGALVGAAQQAKDKAIAEIRALIEAKNANENAVKFVQSNNDKLAADALTSAEISAPAASPVPVAASDTGARIKLGEISAALGFTVTADFLGSLGFQAETDRAAKLYRLADFPAICLAVAAHCNRVAAYGFRRAA